MAVRPEVLIGYLRQVGTDAASAAGASLGHRHARPSPLSSTRMLAENSSIASSVRGCAQQASSRSSLGGAGGLHVPRRGGHRLRGEIMHLFCIQHSRERTSAARARQSRTRLSACSVSSVVRRGRTAENHIAGLLVRVQSGEQSSSSAARGRLHLRSGVPRGPGEPATPGARDGAVRPRPGPGRLHEPLPGSRAGEWLPSRGRPAAGRSPGQDLGAAAAHRLLSGRSGGQPPPGPAGICR